jgi:hypothetical protein
MTESRPACIPRCGAHTDGPHGFARRQHALEGSGRKDDAIAPRDKLLTLEISIATTLYSCAHR